MAKGPLGLALLCCLATVFATSAEAVQYRIRDLGVIAGNSYAEAISSNGQVAGYAFVSGSTHHAVTWQDGETTDLGTLGGVRSVAKGINDQGDVAGITYYSTPGQTSGFLTQNGVTTTFGLTANDVNNQGQVVGSMATARGQDAYVWENGVLTDLGTLGGGTYSEAWGINEQGDVVGVSYTYSGGSRAFVWNGGALVALNGLGAGSAARDINDNGDIVGYAPHGANTRAFIWQEGVVTYLDSSVGMDSYAWGINNRGQVVGQAYTPDSVCHAFVWENGVMTDLGTLGGPYSLALGINDDGYIVGAADLVPGERHAVVWEPVPEPSSMCTLLLGIAGMCRRILRRRSA